MDIEFIELRAGNLVLLETELTLPYPHEIKAKDIYDISIYKGDKWNVSPIPLTEEWLVKFGFKHDVLENEHFKISTSYYDGWHFKYDEKDRFGNADVYLYPANIMYVHQLQNLYFALTGKEIIVIK